MMTQVLFHSASGMIGMAMRDYGQIYRPPRIDVKPTRNTIDTF